MKRLALVFAVALIPSVANAQSLFGTRGLGAPLQGADARARALGVSGVGLIGLSTTMLNPAEAAGTVRRGVTASFQPWGGSVELNGEKDRVGGTRFPLMEIFYPTRRVTFTLGYSGLLDQSWAVTAESRQLLNGDSVDVSDLVRTSGGVGELRLGAAYSRWEGFAIGVSAGLHTGSVQRTVTREFPDSTLGLSGFTNLARWRYAGPTASIGFRWDPAAAVRMGASLTWNGDLEAKPDTGTTTSYQYQMPLRIAAGMSGRISPHLIAAVSTTVSNWGSGSFAQPGTIDQTVARRTIELGGGLEYMGWQSGQRIYPLRLGGRVARLPFHNPGETAAKEWSLSGGLGLRLVQDDFGPLAVADVGVERGTRSGWQGTNTGSGLSENFWRFTVTVSLFGR